MSKGLQAALDAILDAAATAESREAKAYLLTAHNALVRRVAAGDAG